MKQSMLSIAATMLAAMGMAGGAMAGQDLQDEAKALQQERRIAIAAQAEQRVD